jgi:hypothetical protein
MLLPAGWLFADSRTAMIAYFRFHGYGSYLTQAQETAERAAPSGEPAAVTGGFGLSAEYRRCPACRADSFARCHSCHEISCWQSSGPRFRCGFYGATGPVTGLIDSLRATDWA